MPKADNASPMDEDLSEVFQLIVEDERKRRYLKEVGDWLVEEYFELRQASWTIYKFHAFLLFKFLSTLRGKFARINSPLFENRADFLAFFSTNYASVGCCEMVSQG